MNKSLKGKDTFTFMEISELKNLIQERVRIGGTIETNDAQKRIRDKMRKKGFYGKDDWGITDCQVIDLDNLIKSERIKVINIPNSNIVDGNNEKIRINPTPKLPINQASELTIVNKFIHFDPRLHSATDIPPEPGNYILCLRENSKLPSTLIIPTFTQFDGLDVIYTGVSTISLRTRDYKHHFNGHAGKSTLRKSIGALFGYKQIPRDNSINNNKTKFIAADEWKLSEWMYNNLIMYILPTTTFYETEALLIQRFNPPLNLKKNYALINSAFRKHLTSLRSAK